MTNGAKKTARRKRFSKHSESKRDYSYDRSVQHIQHPGFAVKRLNVAVVLNQNCSGAEKLEAGANHCN